MGEQRTALPAGCKRVTCRVMLSVTGSTVSTPSRVTGLVTPATTRGEPLPMPPPPLPRKVPNTCCQYAGVARKYHGLWVPNSEGMTCTSEGAREVSP